MSKSLSEQIKQARKTGLQIHDYLETHKNVICAQKCEWVKLDDVLALLDTYIIIPKQGAEEHFFTEFEKQIGGKIEKKLQWKYVLVDKKKLRELAKSRPTVYSYSGYLGNAKEKTRMFHELNNQAFDLQKWIDKFEKFVELTGEKETKKQ